MGKGRKKEYKKGRLQKKVKDRKIEMKIKIK